jgi:hypothetical protein
MLLTVTECIPNRRLAWATTVDGDETERLARAAEAEVAQQTH